MNVPTNSDCPKCGDKASLKRIGKQNALYPLGCFFVLGLPFSLLHKTSSPVDYECQSCGERLSVRGWMSKFALFILVLFIVLYALMVVYVIERSL